MSKVLKAVCANQRGGVGKTTTALTLSREWADRGKRVLIIDTDPQASVSSVLNLKPTKTLFSYLIAGLRFEDCVTSAGHGIDVLCGSRETMKAETVLMGDVAREYAFVQTFGQIESGYDVILIDVSPSITLLQTCAMVYAEQIIVPVGMDMLSYQGASAAIEAANSTNKILRTNIRVIGVLPVMVDRRLAISETVLQGVESLCKSMSVPMISSIRTDANVTKAARMGQFLVDYDAKSKAMEDYRVVATELEKLMVA